MGEDGGSIASEASASEHPGVEVQETSSTKAIYRRAQAVYTKPAYSYTTRAQRRRPKQAR
jgi:hypothetical protein